MSKLFDEALAKAKVEAKRTQRDIAIVRDFGFDDGEDAFRYTLWFADEVMDDPDVVHIVPGRWVPRAVLTQQVPGESQALGRDGIDEFIDVLRDLFGENRSVTLH